MSNDDEGDQYEPGPIPDKKYWPRGSDLYLERMIAVLAFGEELSPDEWDTRSEEIKIIAMEYNRAVATHEWHNRDAAAKKQDENSARHVHVLAQLKRIEEACNELAASFEEAHPFTLLTLDGVDVPGLGSPKMWHHVSKVASAYDLARRYNIPLSPNPEALKEVKDLISAGHAPGELRNFAECLDWSQAARALGLIAGARRRGFAEGFQGVIERDRSILHEGPDGSLRPSPRGLKSLRTEADRRQRRRKTAAPNSRRDEGGRQNLADEAWGAPKWALTRDCYSLLQLAGYGGTLSAAGDGTLVTFLCSMHAFATGEDTEAATEGGKDRGNHGYGRLAGAAVKIMEAWYAHARQYGDAAMGLVRLDEAFHARWAALQAAHRTGIVPMWLE